MLSKRFKLKDSKTRFIVLDQLASVSECLGFNIPLDGHFGDESFQAIDMTGTDNQTMTKRKYTKHKITDPDSGPSEDTKAHKHKTWT